MVMSVEAMRERVERRARAKEFVRLLKMQADVIRQETQKRYEAMLADGMDAAEAELQLVAEGRIPPTFTKLVECKNCGPVAVHKDTICGDKVFLCSWCDSKWRWQWNSERQ